MKNATEIELTAREVQHLESELMDLDPATVEYNETARELISARNYMEHLERET